MAASSPGEPRREAPPASRCRSRRPRRGRRHPGGRRRSPRRCRRVPDRPEGPQLRMAGGVLPDP
ncbi:hypothetical protein Sfr7A_22665 [Streptomyces xinghaiensis]|uniref:Uncharacterized protein n=1 Tax=Streptomyces xinghaiensis TaxID=1038928 RepID=A0A3R7HZ90_9ACTN|nr:hypothetical protein Sfr7A_22665 [Streptomyces xinghaiensis]RKM93763.1 hypothetical protein SFRA_021215 [Streptomyces xinghaiensis]RNC71694.1 hypothetical protein DC095_021505 [Streptomyces xinghaiensis]